MSTMKPFSLRLLTLQAVAIFGLTAILFVIIEILLRLTLGSPGLNDFPIFEPDPRMGHRLMKNCSVRHLGRGMEYDYMVTTNALGCFDSEYEGDSPNILILGDSVTFGYVALEKNWCSIIEKETGIRTVKAGVPGYGAKAELLRMRELMPIVHPAVVMVGYCDGNDPLEDYLFPYYTAYRGCLLATKELADCTGSFRVLDAEKQRRQADKALDATSVDAISDYKVLTRYLSSRLSFYWLMNYLRYAYFGESDELGFLFAREPMLDWVKKSYELSAFHLQQMSAEAAGAGANFMVVIFPDSWQRFIDRAAVPRSYQKSFRECLPKVLEGGVIDPSSKSKRMSKLLQAKGIDFIDMIDCRDPSLTYKADPHPNDKGNRLIAEKILSDPRIREWAAVMTTRQIGHSTRVQH